MALGPRGGFDRMIRFERPQMEAEALGGERVASWLPIESAMAKVRWGSSEERREAAGTNASSVATFRVLSTARLRGVTPSDRIVFESGTWNITGIATIGGPASEIEFTAALARD